MPRILVSLLVAAALAGPSPGSARALDRDESLIVALRALDRDVRKPSREERFHAGVTDWNNQMLQLVGSSAGVFYVSQFIPAPFLQRMAWSQTMSFASYATLFALGAAATQAGVVVGTRVYRRAYAPRPTLDPAAYKTREGLDAFFRLPINTQYLIAIRDEAFGDYILRLHESLDVLNQGFPAPNPTDGDLP